ncbi:MAG: SDR family oxidoreductase [Pyrinomonadaceae bacterium]
MNNNKVALITGANKGLGLEIGRQLGRRGITVVLGARDEKKGAEAVAKLKSEGLDAHLVKLDATDQATIEALPQFLENKFGRLDILVNNAGVSLDFGVPPSQSDIGKWKQTFETNVFGVLAVTKAVLPLIKQSEQGRIVNHSSILGSLTELSKADSEISAFVGPAYQASKAALNAITVAFANELRGTNVKVNSAHPGWVKTDMGTDEAPLTVDVGAKTAVWLATLPETGPTAGFFHDNQSLGW